MIAIKNLSGHIATGIKRKIACVYVGGCNGDKTLIYTERNNGVHVIAYPDPTEKDYNNVLNASYFDNVADARKAWAKLMAGRKLLSKKVIK